MRRSMLRSFVRFARWMGSALMFKKKCGGGGGVPTQAIKKTENHHLSLREGGVSRRVRRRTRRIGPRRPRLATPLPPRERLPSCEKPARLGRDGTLARARPLNVGGVVSSFGVVVFTSVELCCTLPVRTRGTYMFIMILLTKYEYSYWYENLYGILVVYL